MTTKISVYNLDNTVTSAIGSGGGGVIISSLQIATAAWVVKDDTAVDTAGGYAIITGSGFASGCNVIIGSQNASAVSFVSSTTLRVTIPAQAAGTYTVYVVNPNGAVGIIVNGLTYSGTPSWVTGSTLTSAQVNSAISIQLSATGESVTYALQAGSSLPSGLTLTSGGLLSGTVTGITVETVYNFTIEAIDAQAQDSPRAFSITITANDAYFRNINLLLSADNSSNTFIKDSSNNNFNITINGDIKPSNFNPYVEGYYSNFFDGSGDWINTASSSEFNLSGSNFTVEFWAYPTSSASQQTLINFAASLGDYTGTHIWFNTSRQIVIDNGSTSQSAFTGGTLTLNSWNLVTIVRSSGTTTAYINGLSVGSNSYTPSTSAVVAVGRLVSIGYDFVGYISNLRVSKNIVRYSSNFSVPTLPFSTDANTSLLTCQSNRFIDNSTNNFTITRNGDVRIDGFDPFVPAANTITYGSGFFDGTGDYLALTCGTIGTGNFTIECWIYPTTLGSFDGFMSSAQDGGAIGISLSRDQAWIGSSTQAITYNWSANIIANRWTHIAVTREGTTVRWFVNGSLLSTGTNSSNIVSTTMAIGRRYPNYNDYYSTGYISNARLVIGTAVYTAAFTPSTSPLAAVANTDFLTLQTNQPTNNHMFVDNSTANHLITRAGNATQGSFSPYSGAWSNYFDGTGDWLTFTGATTGSGNFTTEAWVYLATLRDYQVIFDNRATGASATGYAFGVDAAGKPYMYTNNAFQILSSIVITANTWNHVALVRSGTTITLYVNGVSGGTYTSSANFSDTNNGIGVAPTFTSTSQFFGYISNLRVLNGTALYTTSFTPAIQPLLPIANTSLLTCNDNRFLDDSNNNFTLTRSGDISVQKFSPFSMQTQVTPRSYSVYFDGTGDYLNVDSNTAFSFGTNDLTIEFWAYFTSISGSTPNLIDMRSGANPQTALTLYLNGGTLTLYVAGANRITGPALVANIWYHIALVRNSGSTVLYVNGTRTGGTYADTNNYGSQPIRVFASNDGSTVVAQAGYCSNLRVVKGTAVYTANTTPPTAPLTAIANTSLLTCQSTTLIDNSNNAFAITVNGDSRPIIQNPFGYTSANIATYTTTALGGSMYFDGTGDYLTVPDNAAFNLGSSNFTFEVWVYPTSAYTTSTEQFLLDQWASSNYGYEFSLITNGTSFTGVRFAYSQTGAVGNITTRNYTQTIPLNTWSHIAIVRNSGTTTAYYNGISIGTSSDNVTIFNSTQTVHIGASPDGGINQLFYGYLSNMRLVNGTAVYTSAFVPPAAPVDPVRNTAILLNGISAGVFDTSMIADIETVGGASINTSIVKFAGKSSIFFNGTNAGLFSPSSPNLSYGSGDFTIEFWYYPTSTAGTNPAIMTNWSGTGAFTSGQWTLHAPHSVHANKYSLWVASSSTSTALLVSTSNIATNTWTHVAITRTTNTWRMFINGTIEATATHSGVFDNGGSYPRYIGYQPNADSGRYITGYMSDIRLTKGVSRYTANTSAPTSPFITF